ncbi:MAG TPA: retropepsin-like aspartic protease [Candidatus Angelobacter sp.]|nr:retropepsin-like aspartic protease [Candidatus Angelobacter sp.]
MVSKHLICWALVAATALLSSPASAETYRLHFRICRSLILIDATVNGTPVTLLFDTGSNYTILSASAVGLNPAKMAQMRQSRLARGLEGGGGAEVRVNLSLGGSAIPDLLILATNLDDLGKRLGTHCDGIIGQDVISLFDSVRIDYKNNYIEARK